MGIETEGYRYYAFISYSHKDKKIAKKLQKRLESYHFPAALRKSFPNLPKNLKPVFIDESNLVAKGSLREALQDNLRRSKYLIVICSPNSAKSEYVNDEVEYFISMGRAGHIIPLIIDGVPHSEDESLECFPPALLSLPRENELFSINLRKFGRRDSFLMIIATMLELDLDSFVSREAQERKRKTIIFAFMATTLVSINVLYHLTKHKPPIFICVFWLIHLIAFCTVTTTLLIRFRNDLLRWINRMKTRIYDIKLMLGTNNQDTEENESLNYYAFISYSNKDKKIAKKLHKRLERYHLPSYLRKSDPRLPKNLKPIFINESDVVATGTSETDLRTNIDKSNYLIVVCSPNSAKSEYVNDEVDYSIKKGRVNDVIPLIAGGVPHSKDGALECFPPAILALPREQELLGIDLKTYGERDASLRVIATMLHLDIDGFVLREAKERKKKTIMFTQIAAALVLIVCVFNWYRPILLTQNNKKLDPILDPADIKFHVDDYYIKGLGVEQNYAKAKEWYEKAASQGTAEAQYNLGVMYRDGLGVPQSDEKAIEWFKKAAEQGHEGAKTELKALSHDYE